MSKDLALNRKRLLEIKDEVRELHPLLESLFRKLPYIVDVEYKQGNREMGADFILTKKDEVLDEEIHIGIVAKVGRIVQDFGEVERQIDECGVPRLVRGGKKKIRLDEVWVVLTEHITGGGTRKDS